MHRKYKGYAKILVVVLSAVIFGGCVTQGFQYPPHNRIQIQKTHRASDKRIRVNVLPINDIRTDRSSTEGWSLLACLPFVPCMPYHNYDMESYSADTGKLQFSTENDFHSAILKHLNESGYVFADSGPIGTEKVLGCEYRLTCTITRFGLDGYRTLYCLGLFPGCYVAILGAPFNYATSSLNMTFELTDCSGKSIFKKPYSSQCKYAAGEYYNLNPLTFVGVNLCRILNQLCKDLEAVHLSKLAQEKNNNSKQ